MVIPQIKALEDAKARVIRLERRVSKGLRSALANLPDEYGFDSVDSFIQAVKEAGGVKRGPKPGRKAKAAAPAKRQKRATITDAIRTKVKKLAKAGKSGAQIAKAVGISLPSVQNIKKASGLVRSAKKAAGKPKPRPAAAKRAATPGKAKKKKVPKKVTAPEATAPQPSAEASAPPPA